MFRNEEMDKTHLCEFHQIEGFVIDYNLSLANMMQVHEQLFRMAVRGGGGGRWERSSVALQAQCQSGV